MRQLRLITLDRDDDTPQDFNRNHYGTPPAIAALIRTTFGCRITLDVASNPRANRVIKAKHFYTENEDGLLQPWYGSVLVQPPYDPAPLLWAQKLLAERPNIKQAIALLNASTDAEWFRVLARELPFVLTKRINFLHPATGQPVEGNRFGQVVFYFGPHTRRFIATFGPLGIACQRYHEP